MEIMNRNIIPNLAMSVFALGCMFPLVGGPLLSTSLDRDLSLVIIPGTFLFWAVSLILGRACRRTEIGMRAARWSARAILIGLLTLLFMEVRGRMDLKDDANTILAPSSNRADAV